MKDRLGAILHPAQEQYLDRLLPPRDALLREIEERAQRENIPISDPEVGRLLQTMARATGARRILELGTAIGYGTLWLARGAPTARVVSIDLDKERQEVARGYLERAGVADRVELVQGEALEILPTLSGPFDLIYVDAVKGEYRRYLDQLLTQMPVGGTLLFDNLLWKGQVAQPPETGGEPEADAMRAFNGYLMIHPQLESVLLPLGDGVGLATKSKPLILDMGGPY